ncbi:MAG: O-acetylhomoserine aminocarboxypropyltransferase/cysteine synthase [Defluviitaleaceae bacterium]|nr:O-acetylhomoserine aminocarboxypropyltransferase/cysteine synthase [Defluviitaleaceae bacterium]
MSLPHNARLDTVLLHAGCDADPTTGSLALPIYQTAGYKFRDAEHAVNLFSLKESGNIYSRIMNPTNDAFEKRMAALEGGVGALAFASGHAAIVGAICNIAQAGDEIVSSSSLYGGTYNVFLRTLPRMGIKVNFAEGNSPESLAKAVTPDTKAIFAETVGNPRSDVLDIEKAAQVAHDAGIPLIVDATFSVYLNRPIEFGADIVVHSATKFIDGHGSSMGGIVVDAGKFDYGSGKFPLMSDPDPSYHNLKFCDLGAPAYITRLRTQIMRDMGACLAPFHSFLLVRGLETLHLRMERHSRNALAVAKYLEGHERVSWVSYPGLPSHPDHDLANKYMPSGAGAIMAFGVKGEREAGHRFINALRLFSHVANVGDAKSLVIHPASTTHSQLTPEQQLSTGTTDDLIRLSIGVEDINDILSDLDTALKASKQ